MAQERRAMEQRLATLLHEDQPLDEYQQDEVVDTMNTLFTHHDRCWTITFSAVSLLLSIAFFVDGSMQSIYPFQMKHRGLWEPYLSSPGLILCEAIFGACLFFCCIAVFVRSRNRENGFPWTPMSVVLFCCSFFSLYMLVQLISQSGRAGRPWYRLEVLWMPLLPTGYCLLIYYVVGLLDKSFEGLEKLKQRKYAFKSI